jgi:phosphoglycolate phosphatase-like HAD superfamily hydrolase
MQPPALDGHDVEVVRPVATGRFRHALFDFDGTISLLREGWQQIMAPVCVEAICGDNAPTPEVVMAVEAMIDETTGIQTILQMERLVEMVRAHGLVPPDKILDAHGYKDIYNDRLMEPVNERIGQVQTGEKAPKAFLLKGAVEFVRALHERGLTLYIFSGTDRDDVRNEAAVLGVADYFDEIWGALRTVEEYSKEMVLKELIAAHDLEGSEVLIVGDGPVEIRNGHDHSCVTIGVASDEVAGHGWDAAKRERLRKAGADILLPDFGEWEALLAFLFDGQDA